jgi:hypothetical protein
VQNVLDKTDKVVEDTKEEESKSRVPTFLEKNNTIVKDTKEGARNASIVISESTGLREEAPGNTLTRQQNKSNRLLQFVQTEKLCFKCPVEDFYKWLQSEDIISLEDLIEALDDDALVRSEMQCYGLKVRVSDVFVHPQNIFILNRLCK